MVGAESDFIGGQPDVIFHIARTHGKGNFVIIKLYDLAPSHLSGQVLVDFTTDLNETFLTNFKRVQEDVSWFVDKHDYRNKEASWKNSKDSLPRAMTKVNSILSEN